MFFRVKIETMGIDVANVRRHAGLEDYFGGGNAGAALADVMGPSLDIASPIGGNNEVELLVCQSCALEPRPLMLLLEKE